jgi:hypothetical protein
MGPEIDMDIQTSDPPDKDSPSQKKNMTTSTVIWVLGKNLGVWRFFHNLYSPIVFLLFCFFGHLRS